MPALTCLAPNFGTTGAIASVARAGCVKLPQLDHDNNAEPRRWAYGEDGLYPPAKDGDAPLQRARPMTSQSSSRPRPFDLTTPRGRLRTYCNFLWRDHAVLRLGFRNAYWVSEELARSSHTPVRNSARAGAFQAA